MYYYDPQNLLECHFSLCDSQEPIYIPSRSKEAVNVRKRGAELLEIAVQRRSEALKCHSKLFVESLKDGDRQRPLQARPLVHTRAKHHL